MSGFRVLMLYPSLQTESIVSPTLALFSALLKREGFTVSLFDSSGYQTETDLKSSGKVKMANLNVRPFEIEPTSKEVDVYEAFRKQIESFCPDLILVTATESMFLTAINLLSYVNNLKVPVILGGVFATFAPEVCMRYKEIDILCVGEGEYALVDLCHRMSRNKDYSDVPGLWVRMKDGSVRKNPMGSIVNMDANPLSDFSIFEESKFRRPMTGKIYRLFPIETHRGCPYTCRFCNSPAQNSLFESAIGEPFFRKKSLTEVRKELLNCRDVYGAEYFFFWADTFFAWSEKEFDEFCEVYQDIKVPFWCQTRPETVVERRIKKLKELGINQLVFGIEHGNEKFRKEVIDRAYTNKVLTEKLIIPHECGVLFSVNNIIGFPDETRDLVFDTIELNRQVYSDTMSCSIFTPYHGTNLRNMAVKKGYISPNMICPGNSDDSVLNMPPPYLNKEQISALRRVFAMYVKFPKERWPEIAKAEALTPEGNAIWENLRKEFIETFFDNPDGNIEDS
ncbi:MAG: B12-binding domain-containing radical SAM protein [Parcubacteria group bacterium]|nr:B12-binding domain-containing radical SAM protein [Parcubacteria group bacterium]